MEDFCHKNRIIQDFLSREQCGGNVITHEGARAMPQTLGDLPRTEEILFLSQADSRSSFTV